MKNKESIIINLFGGPGSGKSTSAALLFGKLKQLDEDCELVREYAKDLVWEGREVEFIDQVTIFGKQLKRVNGVYGKVDYIVTDSPLLLSAFYNNQDKKEFTDLCVKRCNRYNNLNVLITRTKKYNPNGRFQTEQEANQMDIDIRKLLDETNTSYIELPGDVDVVDKLLDLFYNK